MHLSVLKLCSPPSVYTPKPRPHPALGHASMLQTQKGHQGERWALELSHSWTSMFSDLLPLPASDQVMLKPPRRWRLRVSHLHANASPLGGGKVALGGHQAPARLNAHHRFFSNQDLWLFPKPHKVSSAYAVAVAR